MKPGKKIIVVLISCIIFITAILIGAYFGFGGGYPITLITIYGIELIIIQGIIKND